MARQDTELTRKRETAEPIRTCIGCRQRASKRELVRVTVEIRSGQAVVTPDPEGTAPGRGAHLHPTIECYDLAVRRKAFARALRLEGGPSSAPVGAYVTARATE